MMATRSRTVFSKPALQAAPLAVGRLTGNMLLKGTVGIAGWSDEVRRHGHIACLKNRPLPREDDHTLPLLSRHRITAQHRLVEFDPEPGLSGGGARYPSAKTSMGSWTRSWRSGLG